MVLKIKIELLKNNFTTALTAFHKGLAVLPTANLKLPTG